MSIFDRIFRALTGDPGDPFTLDNVPVKALEIDWRDEAVKKAAERHGKVFKCGPDSVPRERLVEGYSTLQIVRPTNVTPIRRTQRNANKEK